MLGYGLSSLNENHMQEREKKKQREERRRGQSGTKAQSLKPDRVPRGSLLKS